MPVWNVLKKLEERNKEYELECDQSYCINLLKVKGQKGQIKEKLELVGHWCVFCKGELCLYKMVKINEKYAKMV